MANKLPYASSLAISMTKSIMKSKRLSNLKTQFFTSRLTAVTVTLLVVSALHILLLCTLLLARTSASRIHLAKLMPDFPCPASDFERTKCAGPKDCLYARPGSCIEFVECRWSSASRPSYEPIIHRCAPSSPRLEWNDCRKRCDYPGTNGTCSALSLDAATRKEIEKADTWNESRCGNYSGLDGRISSHQALVRWLWQQSFARQA